MKTKAIIIDLDGTLSDSVKRVKFVSENPKDYEKFYKFIPKDKPNKWCEEILQAFFNHEIDNYRIVFLTGRPEWTREMTEKWLFKFENMEKDEYELLMRQEKDYRKDDVVKEEHIKKIKKDYDVLFAIDDRMNNCEMFERNGIKALFCGVKG